MKILCSNILLLLSVVQCCFASGSEELFRQNVRDLVEGRLEFNDDATPPYENDLADSTPSDEDEFDFIVVGAGSAGAVMASRLSEIRSVRVLLLEAGGKEYPIMDVPLMASYLQSSDEINWKYRTENSERYCRGLEHCTWARGKVMGGSSVLNYMLATRGNKNDYDGWAEATGDPSWSHESMTKYLKKLENFNVSHVPVDWKYHNRNGPMHINSPPYNSEMVDAFLAAAKELGFPEADYNGAEQIGFSTYQSTTRNGERWSTNRGYLHTAVGRDNLLVSRRSLVTKISIDEASSQAHGVEFLKNGKTVRVRARKEVIVSAGAINSPQLLMLSGIGPREQLNELGIRVIKDAPVGENLQDHIGYGGLIFKVNDSVTFKESNLFDPDNPDIHRYFAERNGSLALGTGYEGLGYVNVDDDNEMTDPLNPNPNIELLFAGMAGIKDEAMSKFVGVKEEYRRAMSSDKFDHSAYTIWPMLMQPKSRGKLVLTSKDPLVKPRLYPNYLDEAEDRRTLVKGVRAAIRLTKTAALQRYGSQLYSGLPLPCGNYAYDTDDYWECAASTYTMTIYHQCGTCRMGREDDPTSVVDSNLRVIGVKNLRVVDASIMPRIVSAHPNVPVMAIAEKTADVIKQHWNL
ncbi:hypothetical protein TKK_0013550 [Trichogramma kaykai]